MSTALTVPRLHRPPLLLRPFAAADAALVAEASADPLIPLITTVPTSAAAAPVEAFIDRQHDRARRGQGYSFAIADADTDRAMGQIGLWPLTDGRASVGYWVVATARRRGIAQRPCRSCRPGV